MPQFPAINYHPKHKPAKKRRPKRAANEAMSMFSGDWEPPKSKVAEFWEIYHELPDTTETPEVTKIKADVLAAARGYLVKGNLSKIIHTFLELGGKCPWAGQTCPCSRFKEGGVCKKGMLVRTD